MSIKMLGVESYLKGMKSVWESMGVIFNNFKNVFF